MPDATLSLCARGTSLRHHVDVDGRGYLTLYKSNRLTCVVTKQSTQEPQLLNSPPLGLSELSARSKALLIVRLSVHAMRV